MLISIETQYRENYGAHSWDGVGACPQYWKMKGGETILLQVDGFRFDHEFAEKRAEMIIDQIRGKIEYRSDYAEEYIIGWSFVPDDFQTDFEKSQLEFDGEIRYPAQRWNFDEVMENAE